MELRSNVHHHHWLIGTNVLWLFIYIYFILLLLFLVLGTVSAQSQNVLLEMGHIFEVARDESSLLFTFNLYH